VGTSRHRLSMRLGPWPAGVPVTSGPWMSEGFARPDTEWARLPRMALSSFSFRKCIQLQLQGISPEFVF